jgi:integrase
MIGCLPTIDKNLGVRTMKKLPKTLQLPLHEWPCADRDVWGRATTAVDYFDEFAPSARWSPMTQRQARCAYGRWLGFVRRNFPKALDEPAAQRFDRERARLYVGDLAQRLTPMGVAAELGHMILMLRVQAPDLDWSWLRSLQYRYQKRAVPRDTREKMVHPARLIELGRSLMDRADAQPRKGERAREFRDGLLIALLAARPLRRRSLAELTIDQHLCRVDGAYTIVLQPGNTKSGQPSEIPLPDWLAPYLTRYLEHYRLLFPRAQNESALWLSAKGGALVPEAIHALVARRTKAAFGRTIYPHLFRSIAATTIAREAPENIAIARDLLTHASVETTMTHYAQANTILAARDYNRALSRLRATSVRSSEVA